MNHAAPAQVREERRGQKGVGHPEERIGTGIRRTDAQRLTCPVPEERPAIAGLRGAVREVHALGDESCHDNEEQEDCPRCIVEPCLLGTRRRQPAYERDQQSDEKDHPREVQAELEGEPPDVAVHERLRRQVLGQQRRQDVEDEEDRKPPRDQHVTGPGHSPAQQDAALEHDLVGVRLAERGGVDVLQRDEPPARAEDHGELREQIAIESDEQDPDEERDQDPERGHQCHRRP